MNNNIKSAKNILIQMDVAEMETRVIAKILASPNYDKDELIQYLKAHNADNSIIEAIEQYKTVHIES